jgi:hypothetical protein
MMTILRALCVSNSSHRYAIACSVLLGVCMTASAAPRDPTQPPAALNAPNSVRQPLDDLRVEHIVVVNGVRYLVWNSRRYAAGDTVAGARIERISESAVWLKVNGAVRKLLLFPSVEKQPLPNSANAANDKSAMNTNSATSPASPARAKGTRSSTPRTGSSNEIKPDEKNGLKNEK